MNKQETAVTQNGRELSITRIFNSPIDLVWQAWTDPDLIKDWWGPNGFTNTIYRMEVTPGGVWEHIMHGPDGKDYKNKSIFKVVIRHKKIVYDHVTGPKFQTAVLFKKAGLETRLEMTMRFESEAQLRHTIETYKADEGLEQNLEKLSKYLYQLKQAENEK